MVMFGDLHIEMATLKLLGDWLGDMQCMVGLTPWYRLTLQGLEQQIPTHVTKTRYAHQVTAASLYVLLQRAYSEDCTFDDPNSMQLDSPTFEECAYSDQRQVLTLIIGLRLCSCCDTSGPFVKVTSRCMWNP